jgi:hypothetical protein
MVNPAANATISAYKSAMLFASPLPRSHIIKLSSLLSSS